MFPMLVKGMKCPNATFFYLESIYSRVMKESYIRNVTIIKFKNFFFKICFLSSFRSATEKQSEIHSI